MQTGRYGAGAEFVGDRIDVIGGFDAHGLALNSVESYDLDFNRWRAAPPMPTARGDFGISINDRQIGSITVLGGADSHGRLSNVVERYDPPGVGQHPNQWYRLPPMPQARRGLAALPDMIAGGIGKGGRVLSSVMKLTENLPKRGDITWRTLAPMHTPRYDFAMVHAGTLVYAIGGFGPGHAPLRSVEAFNPSTDRWTVRAPMPAARGGLAAESSDGGRLITAVGGFDRTRRALATVEQYDVATNTWTALPHMPVARGDLALTDTEGGSRPGLFALGGRGLNGAVLASVSAGEPPLPLGWSLDTPLPEKRVDLVSVRGAGGTIYTFGRDSTVDAFNPETHRWRHAEPLPLTAVPGERVTAVDGTDGEIYVLVGRTLEAYDPATNRWTERAPAPVYRADAAAAAGKDGKIYVVGGYAPDPGDNSNRLYRRGLGVYDPRTNSWQVKAPMPTAREGLGAAVGPDGTFYAIGGGTDHYDRFFRCYSTVEAYTPRTNTWSKRAALPGPTCTVTAGITARGTIVAVAGSTVEGGEQPSRITGVTGTILAFNPGVNRWANLARAPYPRVQAGAAIGPDGTVYVVGGTDALGTATATMQECMQCAAG